MKTSVNLKIIVSHLGKKTAFIYQTKVRNFKIWYSKDIVLIVQSSPFLQELS